MEERYYKLSQFRIPQNIHYGGWEHVYFSIGKDGNMKILDRDDIHITNSKIEEISKEELERVLRKPSDGWFFRNFFIVIFLG